MDVGAESSTESDGRYAARQGADQTLTPARAAARRDAAALLIPRVRGTQPRAAVMPWLPPITPLHREPGAAPGAAPCPAGGRGAAAAAPTARPGAAGGAGGRSGSEGGGSCSAEKRGESGRRAASDSLPLVVFQATLSRSRHSSWHREWLRARFVVCRPSARFRP